jgi:hypothetical protein
MRMLRSAYVWRIMLDSRRWDTILAVLLWGGVTIFIFGIVVDVIHCRSARWSQPTFEAGK